MGVSGCEGRGKRSSMFGSAQKCWARQEERANANQLVESGKVKSSRPSLLSLRSEIPKVKPTARKCWTGQMRRLCESSDNMERI
jgi:hypothetical protein